MLRRHDVPRTLTTVLLTSTSYNYTVTTLSTEIKEMSEPLNQGLFCFSLLRRAQKQEGLRFHVQYVFAHWTTRTTAVKCDLKLRTAFRACMLGRRLQLPCETTFFQIYFPRHVH